MRMSFMFQCKVLTVTFIGARIVISHPKGREVLEQQRRQFPDVVISDLPDKLTLQNVAADHSYQ